MSYGETIGILNKILCKQISWFYNQYNYLQLMKTDVYLT